MIKTVLNVPVGSLSTELPMPTILSAAYPCQQHPKGGKFIYGNDAKAKNSVNSSLGVPRVQNDQSQ